MSGSLKINIYVYKRCLFPLFAFESSQGKSDHPSPVGVGHTELLLHLAPGLLRLVAAHPPGLPDHLQPEQEHQRGAGVVGDLPAQGAIGDMPTNVVFSLESNFIVVRTIVTSQIVPWYKCCHHPAQGRRHGGHDVEGGQGAQEHHQLVVGHGQDGRDEEGLVPNLRHKDHSYRGG